MSREESQLLEQLEAGVVVTDPAGFVARWNSHAERILGIPAEQALGKPWMDVFAIIRGGHVAGGEVRTAARTPGGWHGLTLIKTADGRSIWVKAHVQMTRLHPSDSDLTGVAIFWAADAPTVFDEFRASDLPYRELFRVSAEPLVLVDLRGQVVDANDVAAGLHGTSRDQMIGHQLGAHLKDWTDADWESVRAELLETGSVVRQMSIAHPTGEPVEVEAVASLVEPMEGGYVLVRMRDLTHVMRREDMLRDIAGLARLGDESIGVAELSRRVLGIVSGAWNSDSSLILFQRPEGVEFIAGPNTSEALRAAFSVLDGAGSPPAKLIMESDRPLELDLEDEAAGPEWAARLRVLGSSTLWSSPLWFADRRIGALALLWSSPPDVTFDLPRVEQMGRFAGLAIGNAELREAMSRDAATRSTLEGTARVGGVVLSQMTEAIVTVDAHRRIDAVNPAAERLFGFRADEVAGHRLDTVFERMELDGSPLSRASIDAVHRIGYWHGRLIQRPKLGTRMGQNIVVDESVTLLRNERREPAGMVAMCREVAPDSHLDTDAAALSSLAVATGRARSGPEVAESALERLCEGTMADFGIIALWTDESRQIIEASRGLSEELLDIIRTMEIPQVGAALDEPGRILGVEAITQLLAGTDAAAVLRRNGIETGFLVNLRAGDQPLGFLALGSRRAAWTRPRDEVVLQVAALVANALQNARLMERLERGLDQERKLTSQLETLMGLTLLPQGDVDEASVAQLLLERVVGAIGAMAGLVVRSEGEHLRVVASYGMPDPMRAMVEARPAEEHAFWSKLRAMPAATAYSETLRASVEADATAKPMIDSGIAAHAVFPIREGDRLLGAFLCYFASAEAGQQTDERNVEAVGRIISIAYSNVRMSESLAEFAEHERRLTAELRALQELTLLGAATDDITRLAQETMESIVVATGASGGGYVLVDAAEPRVDPIVWVGRPSRRWSNGGHSPGIPTDWPSFTELQADRGIWLGQPDPEASGDADTGSQAVLPLRVDDKLAALLHLEWATTPRTEQFDVHFLEPIARICSISLANFRLRSELLHRAAAQRALSHRLATLDELTRIGEEAGSFEELAHRTVNLVREALNAAGVCYLLIEPGHHFETHAVAGETGAFRLWLKGVPAKDAPGGSILLSGGGSVLGDFTAGQVNERVLPLARATGFRSFGAIPIRTGEELAGALLCFFEHPGSSLPLDEAALDSVARIAGIALANYRLRERLVSSEERYRTLFEESPDTLLVSALDGTVLDANEAAIRLYRVNRGEILGRYFGQLISADEREMARRRQIVWAQGRGTFHDRGRRPDNSEFPVEIEIRVVELGGQRRFLHLVRDLSDQERLQRELLQAQKMEAIGQLVSGVAHELNNPLAAIIAFSQLIRSDERLPEDMRHDAELLVQESNRTRRIVQGLLDFARARPPERRPTNIGVLVQSVLELQSYALNTNQIQVKVDIPATIPEVDLDRAQLQQVLLNLTINAIQAIRGTGRKSAAHLTVMASLVKTRSGGGAPRADKSATDQQRVRISVRDDGPGVPESERARLFDPFFTTKQPGEGTGLGLSVSFGIVAAHGGQLWYEPGPGNVGSNFIIELPVNAQGIDERQLTVAFEPEPSRGQRATPRGNSKRIAAGAVPADEAATAEPAAAPAEAPKTSVPAAAPPARQPRSDNTTRRPRILVLDDEPSIRVFLRKALTQAGMDCLPYPDGASAWEGIRSIPDWDVMLIDHRMAGMSGTEFYEAAVELRPEVADRAVFMSGDVLNPELRGFATERGIRLISKPFDIDAVIRVVRDILAATAPSAPAAEPVTAAAPPSEPAEPAALPSPAGPAPASDPSTSRRPRVLVVDDEPSIRIFLQKALKNAGMDCQVFADGATAWEGLRSLADWDVMLIDHRMAGMSGTEFYEAAVKLRPEVAGRAVFMSGDVLNPELRGFATERGIRLLAKPFDIEAVVRVVRDALAANEALAR